MELYAETGIRIEGFEESDLAAERRFFNEFANDRNFDPLVPLNWYPIVRDEILSKKVSSTLITFIY